MSHLESLKKIVLENKYLCLAAGGILGLAFAKLYFRGGVCRVTRDLTGQVIVLTGGNAGIGKQTLRYLSQQPCKIFFGARDVEKSQETIKQIKRSNPHANIVFFTLDLSSKPSIENFAQKVKQNTDRIDILINNAAVMALPERKLTQNGFQMQMMTNHLGHFYLTKLLWDFLKLSPQFRVVNVSSEAHKGFGFPKYNMFIDFNDMNYRNNYNPGIAYGRSKAANILFTRELQKKIDQAGLNGVTVSLHPGVVRTELARYMSWKLRVMAYLLSPLLFVVMKSPFEGAQTTLYTVLQQKESLVKGGYYKDCAHKDSTPFTTRMQNAAQLWEISQRMLEIQFKV